MRYQSAEMIDDLKRSLIEPDGDFVVTNISSDMFDADDSFHWCTEYRNKWQLRVTLR